MELQFQNTGFQCLKWVSREVQSQEQTAEIKLPQSMPDIGKILASWGQWILRSKQWSHDEIIISGGVMTWTLYQPDSGSGVDHIEGWIPFQLKFPLLDTQREGVIRSECRIRNVDARQISDRKIMVRVNISMQAEILEPVEHDLFLADELPNGIELLKRTYPVIVPKEAGEKTFSLDEELTLNPLAEKILRYSMEPEMEEHRIIGDRMVFRGKGMLQILYEDENSVVRSFRTEIPFSQFADLDRSYPEEARIDLLPAVTELSVELDSEDRIRLKVSFTVQYLIYGREMVEVVEDAYCPKNHMTLHTSQFSVPSVLDSRQESRRLELPAPNVTGSVVDINHMIDYPTMKRNSQGVTIECPVSCQVLYCDSNGALQCEMIRYSDEFHLSMDEDAQLHSGISSIHASETSDLEGMKLVTDVTLHLDTVATISVPMVTSLEMGEAVEPDPGRPSVVLRRVGSETLWDIAKRWGSTMSAILDANQLQTEPEEGQLLLIPVP